MRRLSAGHHAAALPGRAGLTRELGWFILIGLASTVAQALLYWGMRHWSPPVLANLVSLVVVTVLNTEANRRLTFRGSAVRAVRAHAGAGGLFILTYLITSGVLLLFLRYRPTSSPAAETLVLVPTFALVTGLRFTVLRLVVFRRHR
ncbi:GtrA family protein [Streptomyces sp. NPDC088146]|uniref:GtrA family protein n=1 Tax=Streptomyces sp. NPDC088146 TaxID=3365829 RepID=UPI00382E6FA2